MLQAGRNQQDPTYLRQPLYQHPLQVLYWSVHIKSRCKKEKVFRLREKESDTDRKCSPLCIIWLFWWCIRSSWTNIHVTNYYGHLLSNSYLCSMSLAWTYPLLQELVNSSLSPLQTSASCRWRHHWYSVQPSGLQRCSAFDELGIINSLTAEWKAFLRTLLLQYICEQGKVLVKWNPMLVVDLPFKEGIWNPLKPTEKSASTKTSPYKPTNALNRLSRKATPMSDTTHQVPARLQGFRSASGVMDLCQLAGKLGQTDNRRMLTTV